MVEYSRNMLRVGNGEVVLRNKDLRRVIVRLGGIMGPQCFSEVRRW